MIDVMLWTLVVVVFAVAIFKKRSPSAVSEDPGDDYVTLTVPLDALMVRACYLTDEWELKEPNPGFGEMKRHQVYSRLIKEFPDRRKSEIALAIEAAIHLGED